MGQVTVFEHVDDEWPWTEEAVGLQGDSSVAALSID
jgi:hypothetical protein